MRYFARQPWILADGGLEMVETLSSRSVSRLAASSQSIGIVGFTLSDALYFMPMHSAHRHKIPSKLVRRVVTGEVLRDWAESETDAAVFPYGPDLCVVKIEEEQELLRYMWQGRVDASNGVLFGGKTKIDAGLNWYEYGRLTTSKLRSDLSITFACVATLNHFVLDRGGCFFNRHAPVIKLREGASEEEHLRLLGLLTSSTA
jgi:hypothetical protein